MRDLEEQARKLYYHLKPVIPRWLQIKLRRRLVFKKRLLYADVWPVDEKAKSLPHGWSGWPEGKKFALVITHDIETVKGLRKCIQLTDLDKNYGFRASINFVANEYNVSEKLLEYLNNNGFEVGVHGLNHDGNLFRSRWVFDKQASEINYYLKKWEAVGFRSPSMYHNLEWLRELNIEYDSSTFDTDPFEPQPDGVGTMFPFWVEYDSGRRGYVEMPYTLPQDHTLFVIMQEKDIDIWKKKLDWIAERGGMALLISHPDYMTFDQHQPTLEEYPARYYEEFLKYVRTKYEGQYWHVLPKEMTRFWAENYGKARKQTNSDANVPEETRENNIVQIRGRKKIWVDLDNSPHAPFFSPIIKELQKIGYEVFITARDCSQTCGLADLFHLPYKRIGRHYGKQKILKVAGTVFRALQLMSGVNNEKPALALSHGSRAQMISAWMLRIPSIVIMDYEHVKGFLNPTWIMMPEVISSNAIKYDKEHIIHYPGIKEDVYIPSFKPDPTIKNELGINTDDILITIRPPATEAHYYKPESEELFEAAINVLAQKENIKIVILPRNDNQTDSIKTKWPKWCGDGKIVIPKHVVNGLNLIWQSDLVISGGGTMNREAAALGVPVYSIFRGKIGAVDRYLSEKGRLTLIENEDELFTKIVLERRNRSSNPPNSNDSTLQKIISVIVDILESRSNPIKPAKPE
jgi:predicted glycosyltransferase